MKKQLVPCLYLYKGRAVTGFGQKSLFEHGDVLKLARQYVDNGADALLVFDFSNGAQEQEKAAARIRRLCAGIQIPIYLSGNYTTIESLHQAADTGCSVICLTCGRKDQAELIREAADVFGKERLMAGIVDDSDLADHLDVIKECTCGILALDLLDQDLLEKAALPVLLHTEIGSKKGIRTLLGSEEICGISGSFVSRAGVNLSAIKGELQEAGISMNTLKSSIPWSEFKLGPGGLVPAIVQDYRSGEVLMLAYMNEESYKETLKSSRMTYWSRSRQELWKKGDTSGHVQYVKSLEIDCDKDTILAKVEQIGAACHTGNRTCFFTNLTHMDYEEVNTGKILQERYAQHQKEAKGQGMDAILKGLGNDLTGLLVEAKNAQKEEVRIGIADLMDDLMALMADQGITWEEVTGALLRKKE